MIGFFFTATIWVFIAIGVIAWIGWSIKTALGGAADLADSIAAKREQRATKQ